jgi:hypothetical protein
VVSASDDSPANTPSSQSVNACANTNGGQKETSACQCGPKQINAGQVCNLEPARQVFSIAKCAGNGKRGPEGKGCSCCDASGQVCQITSNSQVCLNGEVSDYAECESKNGQKETTKDCLCGTVEVSSGSVCNFANGDNTDPAKLLPCGYVAATSSAPASWDGAGRKLETDCACCNNDKTACDPATKDYTCTTKGKKALFTTCEATDGSKETPVECMCGGTKILPGEVCYGTARLQKCSAASGFKSGQQVSSTCACCSTDTEYYDSPFCTIATKDQTCVTTGTGTTPGTAAGLTTCVNKAGTKTTEVACNCPGTTTAIAPGQVCGPEGRVDTCDETEPSQDNGKKVTQGECACCQKVTATLGHPRTCKLAQSERRAIILYPQRSTWSRTRHAHPYRGVLPLPSHARARGQLRPSCSPAMYA